MKTGKSFSSTAIIFLLVVLLYVFAFLVIPFPKNATSWTAFVFTLAAFCVCLYSLYLAFGKGEKLVSRVYGLPIMKVGTTYLAVQLVIGVALCFIGAFVELETWISLILSVVPLAAAIIGLIAFDSVRDAIEEQEAADVRATRSVRLFKINIDSIVSLCEVPDTLPALKKLAEDIKYSDPVTCNETAALEEQILVEINTLRSMVNSPAALREIQHISNLLADRNRICKMYKK